MKKSFSLIELLIVVTIIAVLTGAALPFVGEYLEQSKISKAKNDLDEISRAINAFEVTTGTAYSDTTGNVLKGRFLQKLPIDPWGTPYGFASAMEVNGCTVYSAGPDHVAGTVDDVTANYKGPLAIVSVKWQDVNNDGAISGWDASYPSTDTLVIRFNRMASDTSGGTGDQFALDVDGNFAQYTDAKGNTIGTPDTTRIIIAPDNKQAGFNGLGDFVYASDTNLIDLSTDGRNLIYQIHPSYGTTGSITLGVTTIKMSTEVIDAAGNPGISASVTILAQ